MKVTNSVDLAKQLLVEEEEVGKKEWFWKSMDLVSPVLPAGKGTAKATYHTC